MMVSVIFLQEETTRLKHECTKCPKNGQQNGQKFGQKCGQKSGQKFGQKFGQTFGQKDLFPA